MDRSKVIDKIQKCLRLSKSSNPNEAAAALRQAQKLMALHGLDEHEVNSAAFGHEAVECPIQANQKKVPVVLNKLVAVIKKAFGVEPVIETNVRVSDRSYRIRYFGPLDRVTMAGYAHTVVYRAMEAAWREYLKEHPEARGQRGSRSTFQIYWLHEIEQKVMDIGFGEDEKQIIEKMKMQHYHKGVLAKSKVSGLGRIDGAAATAGMRAAADFNINRPMNQDRARLEKL